MEKVQPMRHKLKLKCCAVQKKQYASPEKKNYIFIVKDTFFLHSDRTWKSLWQIIAESLEQATPAKVNNKIFTWICWCNVGLTDEPTELRVAFTGVAVNAIKTRPAIETRPRDTVISVSLTVWSSESRSTLTKVAASPTETCSSI